MIAAKQIPGQAQSWPPGDWFVDAWNQADLTAFLKDKFGFRKDPVPGAGWGRSWPRLCPGCRYISMHG